MPATSPKPVIPAASRGPAGPDAPAHSPRPHPASAWLAAGVAAIGLAVLGGWALHLDAVTRVLPGLPAMSPNTALGLILLAFAIGAEPRAVAPGRPWRMASRAAAALAGVLGAVTLAQYAFGWDAGIDTRWFGASAPAHSGALAPDRMAPGTALILVLLAWWTGLRLDAAEAVRRDQEAALAARDRELVQATALLGVLFAQVRDAMAVIGPGHELVAFNQAFAPTFEQIAGRPPAPGMRLDEVLAGAPGVLAVASRNWDRALAGEAFEEVLRYPAAAGGEVVLEIAYAPVDAPDGARIGALQIVRDVTERMRTEAEVRRLNAELERRVEARTASLAAAAREMEAFTYSVSHDLRQPLRALDGFSQALLEDYRGVLDETGRDFLDRLRAAAQKMGHLIDALLALSRVGRAEMHVRALDLTALAREVEAELRLGEPGRAIEVRVAEGLAATGDPALVRAVLANLLGNAWKYTARRDPGHVEVGAAELDGVRWFFVRDDGAGFDMAYADKLFKPFQRLHGAEEFPGLGIGLATVLRIVARHGGSLRAEGAPGRGATIWFTLPEGGPS